MFLKKIDVRNYRSISALTLAPCGDFNVLIGRNSAGKSNILSTIDAFFASIKRGWINTAPPLGEEIDFFQKNLSNIILISATFDLSAEELKELFSDVSEERPQVRNLLENISTNSGLVIDVCFKPEPTKFAYVRSITLFAGPTRDTHKLYEVGDQAAKELYDGATKAELADAAKQSLDRFNRTFDSDDYTRAKRSRLQQDMPPLDYFLRRAGADSLPSSTRNQITTALDSAENYNDFVTQVSKLLQATSAEITAVNEQPIKTPIKTFSGEENVVLACCRFG